MFVKIVEGNMKKKTMNKNEAVQFLLDSGLLFQINNQLLHPIGLALSFRKVDDGFEFNGIIDDRKNPHKMVFDDEMLKNGFEKINKFMEEEGEKIIEKRLDKLGYLVQEEPFEIIMKTPEESKEKLFGESNESKD